MEENVIVEIAPEPKEMRIGEEDKLLLTSSARWTQFISIVMFVCYGLGMIAIIFCLIAIAVAGYSMYDITGGGFEALYGFLMYPILIFALVMYIVQMIPAIYLYRFAQKAKDAVASNDEAAMTESLRNLRGYAKTTGIIIIASLAFSLIFMVTIVIVAAAMTI